MTITSSINNYIKLILFSSYILCWISISTTFQDIIANKEMSEFEFKKIFNLCKACVNLKLFDFCNINKFFYIDDEQFFF